MIHPVFLFVDFDSRSFVAVFSQRWQFPICRAGLPIIND